MVWHPVSEPCSVQPEVLNKHYLSLTLLKLECSHIIPRSFYPLQGAVDLVEVVRAAAKEEMRKAVGAGSSCWIGAPNSKKHGGGRHVLCVSSIRVVSGGGDEGGDAARRWGGFTRWVGAPHAGKRVPSSSRCTVRRGHTPPRNAHSSNTPRTPAIQQLASSTYKEALETHTTPAKQRTPLQYNTASSTRTPATRTPI